MAILFLLNPDTVGATGGNAYHADIALSDGGLPLRSEFDSKALCLAYHLHPAFTQPSQQDSVAEGVTPGRGAPHQRRGWLYVGAGGSVEPIVLVFELHNPSSQPSSPLLGEC